MSKNEIKIMEIVGKAIDRANARSRAALESKDFGEMVEAQRMFAEVFKIYEGIANIIHN